MTDMKSGAKYALTNALIGPLSALASTSMNDSVIVVPTTTSDGSQSWYFLETNTTGYYRLHTDQKGDFAALDVYAYNGKNTIDLHMFAVHDATGQYWRLNKQDDGSVRINNKYTGPDIYLDIVKHTLQPTLAARDGPGQRWTLSEIGSEPTATPSASGTTTASTSGITSAPASDSTTGIVSGSSASASAVRQKSNGFAKGAIAGIAVGSAIVLTALVVGAVFLWKRRRERYAPVEQHPIAMSSRPILRVGQE
jgi:hypothetical protein